MSGAAELTLLIDANVWLDHYLGRGGGEGDKASAATELLLRAANDDAIKLAYSSMTAKDVFFLVGRILKDELRESGQEVDEATAQAANEVAWQCIDNMTELAIAVPADETDLWMARKQRDAQADLEDALILAAAQRAKADHLVTGDKQLLARAPALAITPEALLEKL